MDQERYLARGSGPGPQTRDGCSVQLYKSFPYDGELDSLRSVIDQSASVLELGCGTGRLTRKLLDWGLTITAVDNSIEMLDELPKTVRRVRSNIEDLELAEPFDVILLASYIINTPDPRLRSAIAATGKHHLAEEGVFLIECQDPEFLRTIHPGRESVSREITTTVETVTQISAALRISIRYRKGALNWTHEFDVAPLEDDHVRALLESNGLRLDRWIPGKQRWALARHN